MLDNVPKKMEKEALKAFADLQVYMGDGPKGAGKAGHWATLMGILNLALKVLCFDLIRVQCSTTTQLIFS